MKFKYQRERKILITIVWFQNLFFPEWHRTLGVSRGIQVMF